MTRNRCPDCGKELKVRHGQFGPFWGCTGYPKCRFTADWHEDSPCDFNVKQWEDDELQKELDGYLLSLCNGG